MKQAFRDLYRRCYRSWLGGRIKVYVAWPRRDA